MENKEFMKALTTDYATLSQKTSLAPIVRDCGYDFSPTEYYEKTKMLTLKQYKFILFLCTNRDTGDNDKKLKGVVTKFGFIPKEENDFRKKVFENGRWVFKK